MRLWDIHPKAQRELEEINAHYLGIDERVAIDFHRTYSRHRAVIVANPLLYNIRRFKVRRVNLVPRFEEYYIAYMLWKEKVVILAIGHAKRRPYYWRRRIGESREMF